MKWVSVWKANALSASLSLQPKLNWTWIHVFRHQSNVCPSQRILSFCFCHLILRPLREIVKDNIEFQWIFLLCLFEWKGNSQNVTPFSLDFFLDFLFTIAIKFILSTDHIFVTLRETPFYPQLAARHKYFSILAPKMYYLQVEVSLCCIFNIEFPTIINAFKTRWILQTSAIAQGAGHMQEAWVQTLAPSGLPSIPEATSKHHRLCISLPQKKG